MRKAQRRNAKTRNASINAAATHMRAGKTHYHEVCVRGFEKHTVSINALLLLNSGVNVRTSQFGQVSPKNTAPSPRTGGLV